MEIKWIEDFVCLASTSSFSRAAEQRAVSQPAFSRRIRQLEDWVGAPLVSRASFPVELTPSGTDFLLTAQETIRLLYSSREAAIALDGKEDQFVTFIALHTLTVTTFPDWLSRIQDEIGEIVTRLLPDRGGIEANLKPMLDGDVDFLMTYSHPWVPLELDSGYFRYKSIGHERVLPVVGANTGQDRPIDAALRDRTPLKFVSYGDGSFFDVALSKMFQQRPYLARKVVHQNTMSAGLKSMVKAGWGVAWLPESLVAADLDSGALLLASEDPMWQLAAEIRLYRHVDRKRSLVEDIWQASGDGAKVS